MQDDVPRSDEADPITEELEMAALERRIQVLAWQEIESRVSARLADLESLAEHRRRAFLPYDETLGEIAAYKRVQLWIQQRAALIADSNEEVPRTD